MRIYVISTVKPEISCLKDFAHSFEMTLEEYEIAALITFARDDGK